MTFKHAILKYQMKFQNKYGQNGLVIIVMVLMLNVNTGLSWSYNVISMRCMNLSPLLWFKLACLKWRKINFDTPRTLQRPKLCIKISFCSCEAQKWIKNSFIFDLEGPNWYPLVHLCYPFAQFWSHSKCIFPFSEIFMHFISTLFMLLHRISMQLFRCVV